MADRLTGSGMGAGGGDADLGSGDRPVAPGQWGTALGRGSRDLASDSPPAAAAAPPGMLTDPDADDETFSDPDAVAGGPPLPGRKPRRPDLDPDTRLGLAPVVTGDAAPDLPAYPANDAVTRMATGAVAGAVASGALVVLLYALFWTGVIPLPPFVATERAVFGVHGVLDHCVATAASLIAGALWGVLFGLLFERPTAVKGMLFGLLPTLLFWLVVAPLTGQASLAPGHRAGLMLPLLFNTIVWGGILGVLCGHWLRPPYTTDVAPAAADE
jgi:hypothetical protein